jgi:hypothetical protein
VVHVRELEGPWRGGTRHVPVLNAVIDQAQRSQRGETMQHGKVLLMIGQHLEAKVGEMGPRCIVEEARIYIASPFGIKALEIHKMGNEDVH